MKTSAIRDKLYDYIRVADDKKIKAIYMMLDDEIEEEVAWWKDKKLLGEFDAEYNAWKIGKTKAYTLTEADQLIDQLRAKRKSK